MTRNRSIPSDFDLVALRKKLGLTQLDMAYEMGLSLRPYQEIEFDRAKLLWRHVRLARATALDVACQKGDLTLLPDDMREAVRRLFRTDVSSFTLENNADSRRTVALALFCKTPAAGRSKTRLSPPLRPEECSALSTCFIRDIAATIDDVARGGDIAGYAVYTPAGSETALSKLLPSHFGLILQGEGDLGARLLKATEDLLAIGHAGAILVNSDSPTLPYALLRAAADAVRQDAVVLGPALDGGYTLIGLSKAHARLFEDMPWSTSVIYERTIERARELRLPVVELPMWYDVDDEETLGLLESELAGNPLSFSPSDLVGSDAPATRRFIATRFANEVQRKAILANTRFGRTG